MFSNKISLTSAVALGLIGLTSTAFANDTTTQPLTGQSSQTAYQTDASAFQNVDAGSLTSNRFNLNQQEYMRDSYQDIQVTLLGPLKLGVSEDVIQHRFSNIDVNYGSRIQRSKNDLRFDNSTYLKATAATTSVKFKF
ncbi:MAG: hypothetical protein ABJN22_08130 [Litorimonas sp.]